MDRHRPLSWTKWNTYWSYHRISFNIHFNIVICYTPGREHTDVPPLAAGPLRPSSVCVYETLRRAVRYGTSSWVIWFVFAFRCHIQRTILRRCLQASYYANWIFIIQIPGRYLKFLSSPEKQICFSSHFGDAVDLLTFLSSFFILPCFMKPVIKKVSANLEYSKCRFFQHILN